MLDSLPYFLAPAIICAVVLVHRHRREIVHESFEKVARRRGGHMGKAWWILYPRLVVDIEGAQVQVSAMHGGKHARARTFAWIGCADYPDVALRVHRSAGRAGILERMGKVRPTTGDASFDGAFWFEGDAPQDAAVILDAEVRAALLAFDEGLAVSLRIGSGPAYRDGMMRTGTKEGFVDASVTQLPADIQDIERILDLAERVHECLMRQRQGAGRPREAG